jgi:hypothetical protein
MHTLNKIPDWHAPSPPVKYPDLTVVKSVREFGGGIAWHLDFSRHDIRSGIPCERFFASDADACPIIVWPWVDGFEPRSEDWIALGFTVVEMIADHSQEIFVNAVAKGEMEAFAKEFMFDIESKRNGVAHEPGNA